MTKTSLVLVALLSLSCTIKTENKEEKNQLTDTLDFYQQLSDAAISIIDKTIIYDPNYQRIPYPNGDVAPDKGVCTDVVIRAYRQLGIDLQKEVHEDISANFIQYPSQREWGCHHRSIYR